MNSPHASGSDPIAEAVRDAESTLRVIATLPAPRGLEERVIAELRSAPSRGRVLSFPRLLSPAENLVRAVAAAAIAFTVIGGGWSIYLRVQPARVDGIVPAIHSTGFSNAGAVRVPQTLQAPVLTDPSLIQPPATSAAKEHGKAELRQKRKADTVSRNKPTKAPIEQPSAPVR